MRAIRLWLGAKQDRVRLRVYTDANRTSSTEFS